MAYTSIEKLLLNKLIESHRYHGIHKQDETYINKNEGVYF